MTDSFDETRLSQPGTNMSGQDTVAPGQILLGKFRIISRLGAGGMGAVYKVEQIFLKKEFALKTMDARTSTPVTMRRFQQEAKAASALEHPNLVKVHDFGLLENGNPYLVMDYINGVTFAEYLKKNGPISVDKVVPLFAQACFGLMAAHEQSVVHRDIKPGNLMILNGVALEAEGSVKVVDFGIAKLMDREEGEIQALTRTGEIFGSPLYMSPEQCSSGAVDHRTDIYSLGCVLFEMLTGTPPHMGQNALTTMMLHQGGETPTLKEATLGREFPEELELIVAKMLRRYPEQRYQNIAAVAHDLTMLGGESSAQSKTKNFLFTQKAPEPAAPAVVSMSSGKLYALLAITGFIAASLAATGFYLLSQGQNKQTQTSRAAQPDESQDVKSMKRVEISSILNKDLEERVSEHKENVALMEQMPPVKEELVDKDNRKQHAYLFPEISLGDINLYTFHMIRKFYAKARGTVYVPVDTPVGMKITDKDIIAMLEVPSVFKKLPGKDFQSLIFDIPSGLDANMQMTDEMTPELMEKNVGIAFQNLDGWKQLKALHVRNCSLNHDAVTAINNFKELKSLFLESCMLDTDFLTKLPILHQQTDVRLQNTAFRREPVLEHLCGSPNLVNLAVDFPLNSDILKGLQKCPKLNCVQIASRTKQVDDKLIEGLCNIKTLSIVRLFDMALSDAQLKMLIACPNLKEIYLTALAYDRDIERIRSMDPRIKFSQQDAPMK